MKQETTAPQPHACSYLLRPHSVAGAFEVATCQVCEKPQTYRNAHPADYAPAEWEKLTRVPRYKAGAIQIRPRSEPRVMGVD